MFPFKLLKYMQGPSSGRLPDRHPFSSWGIFYYAHLSGYEANIRKGQTVAAGDILGYMGNTGYGSEGTRGKFPVHLHLGIYIEVPFQKELSVNPYWLLKIFEKKIRNYTY